jgi:hypothetical protein
MSNEERFALLKIFKTIKNYYLYHANTNKIFQVNKYVYDLLDQNENKYSIDYKKLNNINLEGEILSIHREAIDLLNKNIISSKRPKISFGNITIDYLKNEVYKNGSLPFSVG